MPKPFSKIIFEQVQTLAQLMVSHQIRLATAESCTGGMLARWLTAVSGSSQWFECGFITYSNDSKISQLSIEAKVLDEYGAVSKETAEQMALGALTRSGANLSASITGIAGPEEGSESKPAGTVYIATAMQHRGVHARHYQFYGDREAIRQQATQTAVRLLVEQLQSYVNNS